MKVLIAVLFPRAKEGGMPRTKCIINAYGVEHTEGTPQHRQAGRKERL